MGSFQLKTEHLRAFIGVRNDGKWGSGFLFCFQPILFHILEFHPKNFI